MDVLWINDFKIPLSVPELTDKMLNIEKWIRISTVCNLGLRRMNGVLSSTVFIELIILLPDVTDCFLRIRFICLNCYRIYKVRLSNEIKRC